MSRSLNNTLQLCMFFLLMLICIFAFSLRIFDLGNNPPGFFADEASVGLNAYTIANYGTDEYGKRLPLFFQAFGEYKNPIPIYATVPFVWIFGLSVFSVRLTSVVLSILTIGMIYVLTKEITRILPLSYVTALLAALLLAISPWHIHISRISFEGFMPFLLCTMAGTYFFLRSFSVKWYLLLSAAFFGISLYTYFPARLFIPFFVIGLSVIYAKKLLRHLPVLFISFCVGFIVMLPLLGSIMFDNGLSRWDQVSIFAHPPNDESIVKHITNNYMSHFSYAFLFSKGDIDMPGQFITRHSVRGFGELYLYQLPFLFVGIYGLYRKKQFQTLAVLLLWMTLYPIGSIFTEDTSAQATRSIIGVIPFQILTAIGIIAAFATVNRHHKVLAHILTISITLCITVSIFLYTKAYFQDYKYYASDFWGFQYGAEDIVNYFTAHEAEYDELVMAPEFNAPHIFFDFFAPSSCHTCIIGLPHDTYDQNKKQLFAITEEYKKTRLTYDFETKHTIFYPNHTVAFLIGEIVE